MHIQITFAHKDTGNFLSLIHICALWLPLLLRWLPALQAISGGWLAEWFWLPFWQTSPLSGASGIVMSVSYTHLDVYKRQVLLVSANLQMVMRSIRTRFVLSNGKRVSLAPVSYTHLDVYKRQQLLISTNSWVFIIFPKCPRFKSESIFCSFFRRCV